MLLARFALAAAAAGACLGQNPSAADLKRALDKRLSSLIPSGFTERRVLYHDVQPKPRNGVYHPFAVTAGVWDYGPGYPANRFYGSTCVGRFENETFTLTAVSGDWKVEGRMTPPQSTCKDNPSPGVSSAPWQSLGGSAAPAAASSRSATAASGEIHIGEWACYGAGGSLLAGLAFHLQANGTYLDGDKKPAGRWTRDSAAGTIAFKGGHLDGEVARGVKPASITLGSQVGCEPWK